jgi:hypothetical protein
MEFTSLARTQVPVTIGERRFILLEGSGDVAIKYRDAVLAKVNSLKDGKVDRLAGLATVESYLLSMVLYDCTETEGVLPVLNDGSPDPKALVSQTHIRSWPNRIISSLYERAKQISGLNPVEEKETKTEEEQTKDKEQEEGLKN